MEPLWLTHVQHRANCGACVYAGCVYLIGGVRRIRRYVTGAVKVVALDTAHERRNDCRLMLILLRLAAAQGGCDRGEPTEMRRGAWQRCVSVRDSKPYAPMNRV